MKIYGRFFCLYVSCYTFMGASFARPKGEGQLKYNTFVIG